QLVNGLGPLDDRPCFAGAGWQIEGPPTLKASCCHPGHGVAENVQSSLMLDGKRVAEVLKGSCESLRSVGGNLIDVHSVSIPSFKKGEADVECRGKPSRSIVLSGRWRLPLCCGCFLLSVLDLQLRFGGVRLCRVGKVRNWQKLALSNPYG